MRDSWVDHAQGKEEQRKRSFSLFALMLLNIFAVEIIIMHLFTPLFAETGWVAGSFLDAAIMTLLCAAPLRFLLARFPTGSRPVGSARHPDHRLLVGRVLCGIFLIEFLVMLLVPVFLRDADPGTLNLADAVATSLASAVPLWWLLFRSGTRAGAASLANTLDTPLRLFALLLGSVFLVNLLQEVLFPPHTFDLAPSSVKILDACITALLSAPLLWILVARPLQKEAESDRSRVSALYAQVVDAIVVMDREGVILSCNPAAERTFGFSNAELRGKNLSFLLQGGRQGLEQLLLGAASLSGAESVLSSELICRGRDGSLLIMDVSLSELVLEGRQEYLLIMRDVTGRKRMEEALRESETRFRQIFEQAEDAIIFFRFGSCEILDCNGSAEQIFGYEKRELQQAGLMPICPGADFAAVSRDIAGIAEGKTVQWEKVMGRRQDGAEILFSLRCKVMVLHGAPITCCTFRDITERVRMEERAHDIQTKLIQANKMTSLGLLVSGVAHEVNNPNNYVTVSARLFDRIWQDALAVIREYHQENGDFTLGGVPYGQLESHSRELLEGIIDGSRRIDEIIGNLKRFVRQDLAAAEEVDLNAVATSAVSLMRHELIKFTNRFEIDLTPDARPVRGSRQQLGQVVINLLINACQALPGKEAAIRLATAFDPELRQMTITVSDEGCGMSQEESRRIMEPFFTTKLERGGTGLGLAICDSIVKDHHGTLGFVSEPGRGTTFTVTIPAGEDPAKAEHRDHGQGK